MAAWNRLHREPAATAVHVRAVRHPGEAGPSRKAEPRPHATVKGRFESNPAIAVGDADRGAPPPPPARAAHRPRPAHPASSKPGRLAASTESRSGALPAHQPCRQMLDAHVPE